MSSSTIIFRPCLSYACLSSTFRRILEHFREPIFTKLISNLNPCHTSNSVVLKIYRVLKLEPWTKLCHTCYKPEHKYFSVCYPDWYCLSYRFCQKSLISWPINHLRVNANIVNRSIGGWQPICTSRIDSLRASRIDSQMHFIWELLGNWKTPITRGPYYLHHIIMCRLLSHKIFIYFLWQHNYVKICVSWGLVQYLTLRCYCFITFGLCSNHYNLNTVDSLNLCVDPFSMFYLRQLNSIYGTEWIRAPFWISPRNVIIHFISKHFHYVFLNSLNPLWLLWFYAWWMITNFLKTTPSCRFLWLWQCFYEVIPRLDFRCFSSIFGVLHQEWA